MTRFETVLERLRALPALEREAVAADIEALLDAPRLTLEQWAEAMADIEADDGARVPHDAVMQAMHARFGR